MTGPGQKWWRSLKPDEWPEIDRQLWAIAVARRDILEPDGPAAYWAAKTRKQVMKGYGQWLGWLSEHGHLDREVSPGCRLSDDHLLCYAEALRDRVASNTVVSRLTDLSEAVRVMEPSADRRSLRIMISRIKAHARPVRDKHARVRHSRELLHAGLDRMDHIHASPEKPPLIEASRYRDGLMIAILAARPIRLANLVSIRIGRQLINIDDVYRLVFEAAETKSRWPIEIDLPTVLTCYLEHYLQVYRPLLLKDRKDDALWISIRQTPLSEQATYCAITKATREELGEPVNPHLFRDSLATSIAVDDPAHVRVAATLLGHTSLKTTNDHYNQAQMLIAHRKLGKFIRDLTFSSNKPAPQYQITITGR